MTDVERLVRSCKVAANMMVNALVRGGFSDLSVRARGHVTPERLAQIVAAYPDKLISPPDEASWGLNVVLEPNTEPMVFHAAMRLWTEREGRSRLVARFRFTHWPEVDDGVVKSELVSLAIEDPEAQVQPWPPAS